MTLKIINVFVNLDMFIFHQRTHVEILPALKAKDGMESDVLILLVHLTLTLMELNAYVPIQLIYAFHGKYLTDFNAFTSKILVLEELVGMELHVFQMVNAQQDSTKTKLCANLYLNVVFHQQLIPMENAFQELVVLLEVIKLEVHALPITNAKEIKYGILT